MPDQEEIVSCDECGKEFPAEEAVISDDNTFCSEECRDVNELAEEEEEEEEGDGEAEE